MISSTNDLNLNTAILDTIIDKIKLIYISKFGLPINIVLYINLRLIVHDIHIDSSTILLDIELNLWVFNCLKSYQLSLNLVVDLILEVFCKKFYG